MRASNNEPAVKKLLQHPCLVREQVWFEDRHPSVPNWFPRIEQSTQASKIFRFSRSMTATSAKQLKAAVKEA